MSSLRQLNKLPILLKGLIKENPVLVSVLGMCPVLAVSSHAINAIGMGLATTFVLIGSNMSIALIRNIIPDKVRIPCYIVFIAGFVTIVKMVIEAYAFPLYQALGIFLPLITVNCIVFARAEIYAKNNPVIDSALDAIGMGAGFTLALVVISSVREIFGSGTWFGLAVPLLVDFNIPLLAMAPGGFIVFGILVALINKLSKGKAIKKKEFNCNGCPSAFACFTVSGGKKGCEGGQNGL